MSQTHSVKTILLVDDDEYLRDIYSTKFQQEGVEVEVANGAEAALELMKEKEFDAVLLDIVMPAMSGLDMLEKVKERGLAGDASIIVLSNQGQPEDIQKADAYDIDGYIVKASTVPSDVLEQVRDIYNKNHE